MTMIRYLNDYDISPTYTLRCHHSLGEPIRKAFVIIDCVQLTTASYIWFPVNQSAVEIDLCPHTAKPSFLRQLQA